MKVRTGFVSNSSTSSFCIIGVHDGWKTRQSGVGIIHHLAEAAGINVDDVYGVHEGEILDFIGSEGEIYWAGIDAEPLLQTMTIPQACQHFQDLIKNKLDIDIPLEKIHFIYDRIST